jgi:hypothetical protein
LRKLLGSQFLMYTTLMKHSRIIFLLIILSVFIFSAVLVLLPSSIKESRLRNYANRLFEYPLPPESKVLSKEARWVDVQGSAGCITEIEMRISSMLTKEEVEKYYKNAAKLKDMHLFVYSDKDKSGQSFVSIAPVQYLTCE